MINSLVIHKLKNQRRGFLAPAHHKPVTAMPVFSSDVKQHKICKSGGGFALIGSEELLLCGAWVSYIHHSGMEGCAEHTHARTHAHTHTNILQAHTVSRDRHPCTKTDDLYR